MFKKVYNINAIFAYDNITEAYQVCTEQRKKIKGMND